MRHEFEPSGAITFCTVHVLSCVGLLLKLLNSDFQHAQGCNTLQGNLSILSKVAQMLTGFHTDASW